MTVDEEALRRTVQDLKDAGILDFSEPEDTFINEEEKVFLTGDEEAALKDLVFYSSSSSGKVKAAVEYIGDRYISPKTYKYINFYLTSDSSKVKLAKILSGKVLSKPEAENDRDEEIQSTFSGGIITGMVLGAITGGLIVALIGGILLL